MAKLQVILDGAMVDEFRLTRGRVTIGRRRHCDILLDQQMISGDHALIERIGRDVYLEDRDSTNGTSLNGRKIKRQMLRFGDEIGIGRYTLRYCQDNAPTQPGFEQTLMMTEVRSGGGEIDTRPSKSTPGPAAVRVPSVPGPLGMLRVVTGSNIGRELVLSKNITTLGKPGVQVAVIGRRSNGYYLSHVEGAVRTRINGTDVVSGQQTLQDGDVVELMGASMIFSLRNEMLPSGGG